MRRLLNMALAGLCILLASCGGGGGSGVVASLQAAFSTLPGSPTAVARRQALAHAPACGQLPAQAYHAQAPLPKCLGGTAAVGAALSYAQVSITDATGAPGCQDGTITTAADGTYTCNLLSTAVAPFFVVVTDRTGNNPPLVSVAPTAPTGGTLTVNATPLTTAILTAYASTAGTSLTSLVASGSIDAGALSTLTAAVVAQLAPVLTSVGASSTYDPFSTPIVAATSTTTGNSADAVLDLVQVSTTGGSVTLSTTGSTGSVTLGSTQTVTAPLDSQLTLLTFQQQLAAQLTQCFASANAPRVLQVDTTIPASAGGPSVTSMSPACQAVAATMATAGVDFLQNGYSFGQFMYKLLNSSAMDDVVFPVPELMVFVPASNGYPDRAVLNFKFVDNTVPGNPGNFIAGAGNLVAGPAPGWWLAGNQHPIDVNLRALMRRVSELNPSSPLPSRYQTGIQFSANAFGPGSVVNGQALNKVRLSGPGLPANGLVFVAPDPSIEPGLSTMDLNDVNGSLGTTGRCGGVVGGNCPIFYFERTTSLTDTTTTGNPTNFLWRQPGMVLDTNPPVQGAQYKVEAFYGSDSTPTYTFYRLLLSPVLSASAGSALSWNELGPQSRQLFDPSSPLGGTLDGSVAVTVDWVQAMFAEQLGAVLINQDYHGTFSPPIPVAPGATSVTFQGVGTPSIVPTSTLPNPYRALLTSYRTLDNSSKSAVFQWN